MEFAYVNVGQDPTSSPLGAQGGKYLSSGLIANMNGLNFAGAANGRAREKDPICCSCIFNRRWRPISTSVEVDGSKLVGSKEQCIRLTS